jgi:hypothetical protein
MPLPANPDVADLAADAILTAKRTQGPLFRDSLAGVIRTVLAKAGLLQAPPDKTAGKVTAELIYLAYPRKVGKAAAVKIITRLMTTARGDMLPDERARYLLQRTVAFNNCVVLWPAAERQYCPHPATWFNQGRYDDDPKEWIRGTPPAQGDRTL